MYLVVVPSFLRSFKALIWSIRSSTKGVGCFCCSQLVWKAQNGEAFVLSQPIELFTDLKYRNSIAFKRSSNLSRRCRSIGKQFMVWNMVSPWIVTFMSESWIICKPKNKSAPGQRTSVPSLYRSFMLLISTWAVEFSPASRTSSTILTAINCKFPLTLR